MADFEMIHHLSQSPNSVTALNSTVSVENSFYKCIEKTTLEELGGVYVGVRFAARIPTCTGPLLAFDLSSVESFYTIPIYTLHIFCVSALRRSQMWIKYAYSYLEFIDG